MLNAVVKDINTVDEAHRGFYKQDGDKFVLQVTGVDGYALENVSGLRSALTSERATREELEGKLKPYEGLDVSTAKQAIEAIRLYGDITPQKAKDAVEGFTRLSAIDPKSEADRLADEKFNNAKEQLTAAFATRETELTGQVEAASATVKSLKGQLEMLMVDNVLNSELTKLGPLEDLRDAVLLLARQSIRTKEVNGQIVVEVVDANGNAQIKSVENGQVVNMTVADLLADLREKKPGLFKPDPIKGLGSSPSSQAPNGSTGVKNPWLKESWNITEQMKMLREKPDQAKQLKAAAGR